ncbi:MAG: hypothetical protein AAF570_06710 [Bacteroidota bacterium]
MTETTPTSPWKNSIISFVLLGVMGLGVWWLIGLMSEDPRIVNLEMMGLEDGGALFVQLEMEAGGPKQPKGRRGYVLGRMSAEGNELWRTRLTGEFFQNGPLRQTLAVQEGMAVVATLRSTGPMLSGLDLESGEKRWELEAFPEAFKQLNGIQTTKEGLIERRLGYGKGVYFRLIDAGSGKVKQEWAAGPEDVTVAGVFPEGVVVRSEKRDTLHFLPLSPNAKSLLIPRRRPEFYPGGAVYIATGCLLSTNFRTLRTDTLFRDSTLNLLDNDLRFALRRPGHFIAFITDRRAALNQRMLVLPDNGEPITRFYPEFYLYDAHLADHVLEDFSDFAAYEVAMPRFCPIFGRSTEAYLQTITTGIPATRGFSQEYESFLIMLDLDTGLPAWFGKMKRELAPRVDFKIWRNQILLTFAQPMYKQAVMLFDGETGEMKKALEFDGHGAGFENIVLAGDQLWMLTEKNRLAIQLPELEIVYRDAGNVTAEDITDGLISLPAHTEL